MTAHVFYQYEQSAAYITYVFGSHHLIEIYWPFDDERFLHFILAYRLGRLCLRCHLPALYSAQAYQRTISTYCAYLLTRRLHTIIRLRVGYIFKPFSLFCKGKIYYHACAEISHIRQNTLIS